MPDEDIETAEEFDRAWVEAEPVETLTAPTYPLPPDSGWLPKDFPQLTVDQVPYSTNAMPRADPFITITPNGWLYIEAGNTRFALPDQEEWNKFAYMVTSLWNAYHLAQQANNPDEGEKTDASSTPDPRGDDGQTAPADHDQSRSRDEAGTAQPSHPESG